MRHALPSPTPAPVAPGIPPRGPAPRPGLRLPRLHGAVALAFALACVGLAPSAFADAPAAAEEAAMSGAQLAMIVLVVLGAAIGVVGMGCAYAVLAAVFPSLASATDRQARLGSSAAQGLLGSLAVAGVLVAIAGVAQLGSPMAAGIVGIALGGPALLLSIAGSLGTVPLLGERLLGAAGAAASPLRRAIVGSVALGLAFVPGLAFRFYPLALLLVVPLIGWPLGVAVAAWLARGRGCAGATGATASAVDGVGSGT